MGIIVSVPFNAGRGLMHIIGLESLGQSNRFSTLQCGSWIDALEHAEPFDLGHIEFQYPSMRVVD